MAGLFADGCVIEVADVALVADESLAADRTRYVTVRECFSVMDTAWYGGGEMASPSCCIGDDLDAEATAVVFTGVVFLVPFPVPGCEQCPVNEKPARSPGGLPRRSAKILQHGVELNGYPVDGAADGGLRNGEHFREFSLGVVAANVMDCDREYLVECECSEGEGVVLACREVVDEIFAR